MSGRPQLGISVHGAHAKGDVTQRGGGFHQPSAWGHPKQVVHPAGLFPDRGLGYWLKSTGGKVGGGNHARQMISHLKRVRIAELKDGRYPGSPRMALALFCLAMTRSRHLKETTMRFIAYGEEVFRSRGLHLQRYLGRLSFLLKTSVV